MRIGYVLKRYPRLSETFVLTEILAHERAGLDLEIFALRPTQESIVHDLVRQVRSRVTYLAGPSDTTTPAASEDAASYRAQTLRYARELVDLVAARGITHLHAHFATRATAVARAASTLSGVPYSFTAHAKDIFHESVREGELRARLRDASATVTVSAYNVEHLRTWFGDDAARVRLIHNGIDLTRFSFMSPAARGRRILAVGRLVEKKGFDVLVRACARLAARGCDFLCDIIGGGECEASLRSRITSLGLEARVRLRGSLTQRDVIDAITRSAVLAVPCVVGRDGNRDGLPTVLLEAMALGTPCVSTDVTGIPEVVRDRHTGRLVHSNDDAALADAIQELLDSAALRARLAHNARRLIEASFDIAANAATQRALFAEAAHSRSPAACLV